MRVWDRGRAPMWRDILGLVRWADTMVPALAVGQHARRREVMENCKGARVGGAAWGWHVFRLGTPEAHRVLDVPAQGYFTSSTGAGMPPPNTHENNALPNPHNNSGVADDPSRMFAAYGGYDDGDPSPHAQSCRTCRAMRRTSPRRTAARTDTWARCTFGSTVCLWPILTLL
jgi:hypothetical protein